MRIIRNRKSFDLDNFLKKPLFAHLSTMSEEGPRDSPVWFHWERERIWIIGITSTDSFPKRIQKNPKCAIGIVDYRGLVLHAGFRGHAEVKSLFERLFEELEIQRKA